MDGRPRGAAFDAARRRLGAGPGALRDYTKSMKHYWHQAAYLPDLADGPAAWAVAERFRELRGEDLAGGSCCAGSNRSPAPTSAPGGSTASVG